MAASRVVAVIAGSGLGGVADCLDARRVVHFSEIDGVGACSVEGHAGEVREGTVGGHRAFVVLGRRHGYEGEPHAVDRLVVWLAANGASHLLVTSAAGALTTALVPGDLVVVRDVIDRQNARRGRRLPSTRLGVDGPLTADLERASLRAGILCHRGTLVCGMGPAYETRSEVAALQYARGDVATMSAAPEIAAAARHGMRVAALAMVTNPCTGIASAVPAHAEVLREGRRASAKVGQIIRQLIVNK